MDILGEHQQPVQAQFSDELESPFLDENLFAGEEDEFGARLATLETVSPFLDETEMDWTGLETPDQFFGGEFSEGETGVINGDNRLRVKKTDGIPWRWICKISIRDSKGRDAGGGTGVLISDRHVLTAAHVIYQEYVDPINYSVEVIPALNWGDEPFGSYPLASRPKIPKRYDPKSKNHLDFDYALLTLNTRIGSKSFDRLGKMTLCYWGHPTCGANTLFQRLDPNHINEKAVYTAGYPGKKGGKQLWCASGILHAAHIQTRTMYITADTTKGQSGSPVWLLEGGKYFLVGIAAGAGTQINIVVRITRELTRQVRAWIREDGDTPTMIVTEAMPEPSEFEDELESDTYSVQEDEAYGREEPEDWEWESSEEEAEEGFSELELRAGELLETPVYTEVEAEDLTFESEWTEHDEDEEFDFLEENLFADEEAFPNEEAPFDREEDEFYQEVLEAEQNPAIPASIAAFAVSLGKEWSQRRNGDPTTDAITQWLLQDYQDTLKGAQHRWGKRFNTGIFTVDAIGRAWMVSRQENMKFQLLSSNFRRLLNFHPPKSKESLVTSNLIEDSNKAPVAPIMVQFVQALRQHYPSFHASTYRGHGGGDFLNRGYSIDLFLQSKDSRGFYQVDEAVKFLRAMHVTAGEVNSEWRVIYNDFSAAKVINQETGRYHVIFVGKASKNRQKEVNGIIWHGPNPLILHFHLDLVPRGSGGSVNLPSRSSATLTSSQRSGKPPVELVRFAQHVLNAAEGERLDDDGDLGPLTRGALERFRKKYNLGPGGILDTKTEIALVQRALEEIRQQSLFPQFGVLDTVTRDRLVEFKASHGLGTDPSLNAATRLALTGALTSPLGAIRPSVTLGTSGVSNWSPGLTPPTDPSKYRKFRLTTYYVTDQKDSPTGSVSVPIFDVNGRKIAEGSPQFFAKLSLEGSALLTDGRLINVTGKLVPVNHNDYADVLVYHNQAYARRNAKLRQEGRGPVSTKYSGIDVKNGRVVRAFAFHEVPQSKRGVGFGTQRDIPFTPFRTLAADIGIKKYARVDPNWKGKGGLVPPGTHVYIKEYDGLKLPDNTIHDGWFIVNDTGGAIFGAHFDVFVGTLDLHNQVKKLPSFGQVWFDGIEQRIPSGYTRGLKP